MKWPHIGNATHVTIDSCQNEFKIVLFYFGLVIKTF